MMKSIKGLGKDLKNIVDSLRELEYYIVHGKKDSYPISRYFKKMHQLNSFPGILGSSQN